MAMNRKYVCRDTGLTCDIELQNEDEEQLLRDAEEHLRLQHPERVIEQNKIRGFLQSGFRPGV